MRKSDLKNIIRECIEEMYLEESMVTKKKLGVKDNGKKSNKNVGKRIRGEFTDYTPVPKIKWNPGKPPKRGEFWKK